MIKHLVLFISTIQLVNYFMDIIFALQYSLSQSLVFPIQRILIRLCNKRKQRALLVFSIQRILMSPLLKPYQLLYEIQSAQMLGADWSSEYDYILILVKFIFNCITFSRVEQNISKVSPPFKMKKDYFKTVKFLLNLLKVDMNCELLNLP